MEMLISMPEVSYYRDVGKKERKERKRGKKFIIKKRHEEMCWVLDGR